MYNPETKPTPLRTRDYNPVPFINMKVKETKPNTIHQKPRNGSSPPRQKSSGAP